MKVPLVTVPAVGVHARAAAGAACVSIAAQPVTKIAKIPYGNEPLLVHEPEPNQDKKSTEE